MRFETFDIIDETTTSLKVRLHACRKNILFLGQSNQINRSFPDQIDTCLLRLIFSFLAKAMLNALIIFI